MKKIIVGTVSFLIMIVLMIAIILCFKTENVESSDNKLQIVATLFPQYDFAKHVAGDKANVKLLLNSGVEAHNYEPTAKDMITIVNKAELFIYTGEELEPWTSSIVNNLENTNCKIVNISNGINLIKIEDFEAKHLNSEILLDEHEEEEEIYDEHIWLSTKNACIMINNICEELSIIDQENADYYRKNADSYIAEISKIDSNLKEIVNEAKRKEIAVGGEFAYSYLVEEYGLNFVSVYNNCGAGEDPSIAKVKSVIDYINKYKLPAVFYEELSEGTIAKMIAEETNAEPLVLYSIHNGNIEEDTYVSLMEKNLENLKKALKEE